MTERTQRKVGLLWGLVMRTEAFRGPAMVEVFRG